MATATACSVQAHLLLLLGTNAYDIAGLQAVVGHLEAKGETVWVITPPPRRMKPGRKWSPAHANYAYNQQLRGIYGQAGSTHHLLDVVSALTDPSQPAGLAADVINPLYDADGVHLNSSGYEYLGRLIAAELARRLAE